MVTDLAETRADQDAATGRFLPGNRAQSLPRRNFESAMHLQWNPQKWAVEVWRIAMDRQHRDQFRALEHIGNRIIGMPKQSVDVSTDNPGAEFMRQLWGWLATGQEPASTDVLDVTATAVDSASLPAADATQET